MCPLVLASHRKNHHITSKKWISWGKPVPDIRLDIYREKLRCKVGKRSSKSIKRKPIWGQRLSPFFQFSVAVLPFLSSAAAEQRLA